MRFRSNNTEHWFVALTDHVFNTVSHHYRKESMVRSSTGRINYVAQPEERRISSANMTKYGQEQGFPFPQE